MPQPDDSQAARFLREWAAHAAEAHIDGREFLAAAQMQFRRMAEQGSEQDGRVLTRLHESLANLDPDELQKHLELIAWAIESVRDMNEEIDE
jgi:hypothetical protein